MQRQFNVFSPVIVTYPNETFEWVVTAAELGTNTSVTVEPADGSWPLDQPSYVVTADTPVSATVTGNTDADFECKPTPAPNVTVQKIITAPLPSNPACNGAVGVPGDYFIWSNETFVDTLIIKPDPASGLYWPLPQPYYAVPPNSWIAVEIPDDAIEGAYPVIVENKLGQPQCPQLGQPVIIVQSNGGLPGRRR
jgi:hypothetical protein